MLMAPIATLIALYKSCWDVFIRIFYTSLFMPSVLLGRLMSFTPFFPFQTIRLRAYFKERGKAPPVDFTILQDRPVIWIHVCAIGEFTRIRPLLILLRKRCPEYAQLLTVFTPSAYYAGINSGVPDLVMYGPWDTPKRVRRFFTQVQPSIGLIVRDEIIKPVTYYESSKQKIPIVCLELDWRPGKYGHVQWIVDNVFPRIHSFCVPNEYSKQSLMKRKAKNVTIVGDGILDNVYAEAKKKKDLPIVAHFKGKKDLLMIWGSMNEGEWLPCLQVIKAQPGLKHIIAPRQVLEHFLVQIERNLPHQCIRYSACQAGDSAELANARVLILDNMGILMHMYRYADIAYVTGGKRGKLHSTSEPAAHGIPVLLWKNKRNLFFPVHADLLRSGGAIDVKNAVELQKIVEKWVKDDTERKKIGAIGKSFVEAGLGASEKMYNHLKSHHLI